MVLVTDRGLRTRPEGGAVAILVAVLSTALFAVAALVVDLGFARDTRRQAQVAADAASLAAGNVLYGNGNLPKFAEAVAAAKRFAADNFDVTEADWTGCTDDAALRHQPSTTPCISFQSSVSASRDATKPDTVRVRIPVREVRTSFGAVAGCRRSRSPPTRRPRSSSTSGRAARCACSAPVRTTCRTAT